MSRRKSTAKAKLKAANQQERIKLWKQHFENLLGNPPKITHEPITRIISKQLDIKLGPFTQGELDSVLRKIKNRKAAGLDEIPPEVWKTRQFDDILLRHCNAVYNQNPIDRWTKGCILPFPKKGDLGLAKNYRGITLTSIAAKIYNALLRNRIEPKIDNILRKNQNGFRRNRSTTSQILTIRRILEGVRAKNLQATLIFVDFTKAFDSIHRGKMEQILLAYGIPKETVAAITILYRNTKVKVRSPDGDTEYFDIVAGVLQGDTLAPYLFIICLDYVLRTSIDKIKENGFELTKKRSRRYPATTITDADYADDIAILANTPDQAETLLHSLERAAASIGLHVNAHKTEYMCYNQTGDISTLEGTPLKLVDKFTYLGSSVESTKKDIDTRLTKAWTAINRLSTIWKSDLTDKMKRSFFQAAVTSILLYGCTTWTLTRRLEKKLDGNYTRMLRAILNKSWQRHPTRHQLYGHLPPITKSIQVRRTRHAGHCWRSRDELIRDVLLWIPTHGRAKAGRPARTYIQQLCEDTGCCPEDLPRAMNDREEWRERVRDIRAASTIWWWWWWWHCNKKYHIMTEPNTHLHKTVLTNWISNLKRFPFYMISIISLKELEIWPIRPGGMASVFYDQIVMFLWFNNGSLFDEWFLNLKELAICYMLTYEASGTSAELQRDLMQRFSSLVAYHDFHCWPSRSCITCWHHRCSNAVSVFLKLIYSSYTLVIVVEEKKSWCFLFQTHSTVNHFQFFIYLLTATATQPQLYFY